MRLLLFFAATKDLRTGWMEHPLINQLIDRASRLKYGIHLDQWLRPEHAITKQFLLDILLYARITNLDKTANIRGVVSDEFLTQIKNIHALISSSNAKVALLAAIAKSAPFEA